MRGLLSLSLLPLLAAASPLLFESAEDNAAPIFSSSQSDELPDSYIVVFKKGVSHVDAVEHHDWINNLHVQSEAARSKQKRDLSDLVFSTFEGLKHTYNIPGGLLGYSGHFDESVIESVRRHPQVSNAVNLLVHLLPRVHEIALTQLFPCR